MQSAAFLSSQPCDVLQNAHGRLPTMNQPVRSFVHSVPSSVPQQHEAEGMDEAIGKTPRKSVDPKNTARTSLREVFRQHVTDPAKIVAQKVGASPDSVESYRSGNIPQSWAQMIAFCRAYPAFGLEVLELMGLDIDRDREAYGIFLTLQKRVRGE
jgi:hypothetical protein